MQILGGIAKDAGLSAAQEVHATATEALKTVDEQTIPAAEAAAKAIVGETVNGLYAVLVDVLNRLHGAELPVDIRISVGASITGKIGALKLNVPAEMPAQSVEVKG